MSTPKRKESNSSHNVSTNSINVSPFPSPVAQIKQHAAGNLTGELRKVKDIAVDFHNLAMKWKALNSQGMDLVTQISNIKIEKVFNPNLSMEGENYQGVTLPPELNPLCDQLCAVVDSMEKIDEKLKGKASQVEGLISLKKFQKKNDNESSLLFITMTLEDAAESFKTISEAYSKELLLKKSLCKEVAHAEGRDAIMFYSVCWMHQPYLDSHSRDILHALLKETCHIK